MDNQPEPAKQKNLMKWGIIALIAVIVLGVAGWAYQNSQDNVGKVVATKDQYPDTDLDVCLDGKENVRITKDRPLQFDTGSSATSGTISLLLANHILAKQNGDFEVAAGSAKGMHHIDKGFCRF